MYAKAISSLRLLPNFKSNLTYIENYLRLGVSDFKKKIIKNENMLLSGLRAKWGTRFKKLKITQDFFSNEILSGKN